MVLLMVVHLRECGADEDTGAYHLKTKIKYARVPEVVEHATMCCTSQEVAFVVVIWSDKGDKNSFQKS
jgi:hypothetical protein